MQNFFRRCCLLLILAALLPSCSFVPFVNGEVRMSAEELTQKMAKRFPLEKNVGGLLEITLANPRVDLSEADNRITTSFQIAARMTLGGKSINGNLRVSGRPEYEADSRTLFLRDARVDELKLDNMSDGVAAALGKTVSTLARDSMVDRPLHTFRAEDFTKYGIQYTPQKIFVRGDHLVLTLK